MANPDSIRVIFRTACISKGFSTMFSLNKTRNNLIKEAAIAHRNSLQKSIEHRLEVARAKGDEALIHQLEAEASYLRLQ